MGHKLTFPYMCSFRSSLNIWFAGDDVTPTPEFQNDTDDAENSGNDELFDPEIELEIDYFFQEFLQSYLALENQTALYKMGHKYKDFVFDCNFRGIDCRYIIEHDSKPITDSWTGRTLWRHHLWPKLASFILKLCWKKSDTLFRFICSMEGVVSYWACSE